MKLSLSSVPGAEIIHHAEDANFIYSYFNNVYLCINGHKTHINLPLPIAKQWIGKLRLIRRALRLDKMNVVPAHDYSSVLIIYRGALYKWDSVNQTLIQTGKLENCRNVLHQGILVKNNDHFYVGEYGANPQRKTVKIWASQDGARSWQVVYEFTAHSIKHIHGIYEDPFTETIWVTTGDFVGECYIYIFDKDFNLLERLGDGNQVWRTVSLIFRQDYVYWIMDSQLETSYLIQLCRQKREITKLQPFPGPVWYIKDLADGVSVVATAYEKGASVSTKYAHIFASNDCLNWQEVIKFKHDGLSPKYFKNGVIGFATGKQSSNEFYLFGEALIGLDGKAKRCSIAV